MKYLSVIFFLSLSSCVFATDLTGNEIQYDLRIDGITCPFCVATSSKALKQIAGVKAVSANLEKGIIKVCTSKEVTFTDQQLTKLFLDKGFTYRGMSQQTSCDKL